MKRKLLAITLTLAMLASLFSVAGVITVSAATNFGTPVTTVDDLPDSPSLIAGLVPYKVGNTTLLGKKSGSWDQATDGLIQGVNQKAKWKLTESPTYTYNDVQYMQPLVPADWVAVNYPELDASKAWYLSLDRYGPLSDIGDTRVTTDANDNGTVNGRPVYDLGEFTKVEQVMLAISAEVVSISGESGRVSADGTSNRTISATKLEAGLVPKAVSASLDNTFYEVKVYVADKNDSSITSEDNLVLSWDNTDYKADMSLAALYDVDTVKWGRYICIDFSCSRYGSLTRVSELAVYGTQTGVLSAEDLPTRKSLIAGRIPTKPDGGSIGPAQNGGAVANITDGLVQGLNQPVTYILSDTEQTVTDKNGNTFYNPIAPTEFVEKYYPDYDSSKTWYFASENTNYRKTTAGSTRLMTYTSSAKLVFDLATEATIDEILIASTWEISSMGYNSVTSEANVYKPTLAQVEATMVGGKGDSLLYKADVYVADTLEELQNLSTANKVVGYDWSSSKTAMEIVNKFTLDEPTTGRYVCFDLSGSTNGTLTRISELAVYGSTDVTTYNANDVADNMTAPEDNILKNAVDAYYRHDSYTSNTKSDMMTGVLLDGAMSNIDKLCPGDADSTYFYFTYDLETAYDIDSLFYAGDGTDGANSVAVYIGDEGVAEILANGTEPDYYYDGGIGTSERVKNNRTDAVAIRFDTAKAGRYVTFRLEGCSNNSWQVWVSEFAATGTPVTISTGGAQMRDKTATSNYAVRFGFHMATDSIGYADDTHADNNYARADLTDASMTVINGKAVQVVEFGAVVSNASSQTAEGLVLENCSDDAASQIKNVRALNLYAVNDGYISYTAVVTNIPTGFENRALYARPYITYMDGDVQKTIYGEMHTTSVEAELAKIA